MNCCQCQGIEELFNESEALRDLERYRRKGPDKTTRVMIEAIKARGILGDTLLDIGGGVGGIQHELLDAGARSAIDVDASGAYIQVARNEAERRGLSDRVRFHHGNFVDLAGEIPAADIVTLDRVICCYHDMERMVDLSAAKAQKLYGLVYPRYTWWTKLAVTLMNVVFKLQKSTYRAFVHSTQAVEEIIRSHGLKRAFSYNTLVWQVVVYTH